MSSTLAKMAEASRFLDDVFDPIPNNPIYKMEADYYKQLAELAGEGYEMVDSSDENSDFEIVFNDRVL
jgi:hypothetical protein